jgi:hypothetical protein
LRGGDARELLRLPRDLRLELLERDRLVDQLDLGGFS